MLKLVYKRLAQDPSKQTTRPSTLFVALCALTFTLAGCGGSGNSSPSPSTSVRTMATGNWGFTASSTSSQTFTIGASISTSKDRVSGIAHVLSTCYNFGSDDVPFSGTVDSSGALSATSATVGGQTLIFSGLVASDGASLTGGKYAVKGGCADADSGSISGGFYPAISGTFKGAITSASGTVINANASLVQSASDIHGLFHETGSVAFTGSPCFAASTIANALTDSLVLGNEFDMALTVDPHTTVFVTGRNDLSLKHLTINYSVAGGICSGDSGSGTLAVQ